MRWPPSRGTPEPLGQLLFLERAALAEPVAVEVDRPGALHPRVTGFWRGGVFHRVIKIVETRYEYGEMHIRAVTEDGAVDLCRRQVRDPRTLRPATVWELCAELDTLDISRPI
ncbi:MAG TPA: hypothetical protein VNN19_00260 [bacterium]|nr:hypothetical protein [bacterium]